MQLRYVFVQTEAIPKDGHTVRIRVFGEQFKIYTRVLRGVIYTLRSKVSMAIKALYPGGVKLKHLYKHPHNTLIYTV